MRIFGFIVLVLILGTIRILYKKKFLLSVIIALEFLLLNRIALLVYLRVRKRDLRFLHLSIFVIALSAVEARIGISILSFLSRKLSEVKLRGLRTLKV